MRISDWSSDVCSSDLRHLCIHADIEIVSKSNVCLVNDEIDRPGGYCLNPGKPGFDLDDPVRKARRRSRVQRRDRAHDRLAPCLHDHSYRRNQEHQRNHKPQAEATTKMYPYLNTAMNRSKKTRVGKECVRR